MSGISNYGTMIGGTDPGDRARYDGVDLGSGYPTFSTYYARGNGGDGTAEIRLDSVTGTLAGTLTLASTGSWSTFATASTSLTGAIYVVFPGASGTGNFDWFEFSG